MKNKFLISSLAVLAIIVSACASATPMYPTETVAPVVAATTAPTSVSTTALSSGQTTINVAQDASLGSILVDSNGMTLYLYTKDTPNTSNCYGTCASYWPPLLTTGTPTAGTGVTPSMLGTTTRTDGTTQVTYNGWPLYYYASDKTAGDTTGENVQGVWYVITPDGVQK